MFGQASRNYKPKTQEPRTKQTIKDVWYINVLIYTQVLSIIMISMSTCAVVMLHKKPSGKLAPVGQIMI